MEKQKFNLIVNFLAFISFVFTAISGLAMKFLPKGAGRGASQAFWGIERHDWSEIHELAGIFLIIFVLIHLLMHRNWIMAMVKNTIKKSQTN